MTTIYVPRLIESADLPMGRFPAGTIATHPEYWPVERCSCSRWESDGPDRYDPDMIGWTALVPIEAEQETRSTWAHIGRITEYQAPTGTACGAEHDERTGEPVAWETRYVTPWEEV